jgi:hypothetical protein
MAEYQRAKSRAVFWLCSIVVTAFIVAAYGLADRISNGVPL